MYLFQKDFIVGESIQRLGVIFGVYLLNVHSRIGKSFRQTLLILNLVQIVGMTESVISYLLISCLRVGMMRLSGTFLGDRGTDVGMGFITPKGT